MKNNQLVFEKILSHHARLPQVLLSYSPAAFYFFLIFFFESFFIEVECKSAHQQDSAFGLPTFSLKAFMAYIRRRPSSLESWYCLISVSGNAFSFRHLV